MPGIDINFFLRQANKLTEKIEQRKTELAAETVTGAAGDLIAVTVSGAQELKGIKIDPKAIDAHDLPMLEDLILAAVNQGLANSRALMKMELEKVTNGVKLPGIT